MRSICVFCGSSPGLRPEYVQVARDAGRLIAERGWTLVYGGGRVGLMGAVADAALAAGGRVVGVIPKMLLDLEVGHLGLSELRVVQSLAERKQVMGELSDAFLSLPGGLGTLDELCEVWTWAQLGLHRKPCGLLNPDGYFDALIDFMDHAVAEGFQRPRHRALLLVETRIEALLDRMQALASS